MLFEITMETMKMEHFSLFQTQEHFYGVKDSRMTIAQARYVLNTKGAYHNK